MAHRQPQLTSDYGTSHPLARLRERAGENDPVLALVSGNNGLGQAAITPDRYNVRFTVDIAPGQSLSLLNFACLASQDLGSTPADVTLAEQTGQSLLNAPRLEGLSADQIASIANFSATVPEPSNWALLAIGVAALGWQRRAARND
ncbi:PEP-CTERM sorting domain-containing protein [Roseateles sp.]|uniref:PEP-CTERM sorting domain-containing protein n=1 Tax=Roseateles sp. TaxID=1971397 RepID=UPI0031D4E6B0